ncbi:MAG: hypothetical protein QXF76_00325 [Candidatus Anstonellales archaeon]
MTISTNDIIKNFKLFGERISKNMSDNAVNSYFFKLYNAVRYEDVETFSLIFTRIIVLSDYDKKHDLLELLNQSLYENRNSSYSNTSIMQIILMAFLSGYYEKVKEDGEEDSA